MLSKEVMVGGPLLVWLYDATFLTSPIDALRRHRRFYLGMSLSWVALAVVLVTSPWPKAAEFEFLDLTPLDYARTQLDVIAHYLRLVAWPSPLVVDYADWPIARSLAEVAPQAALIGALLTLTALGVWRRRWWGFLGAWAFVILAPTSSVLPIVTEIAAERRMYLPTISVVIAAVVAVWSLIIRIRSPQARRLVAGVVVAAVGGGWTFATWSRNDLYGSDERLWTQTLADRPLNPRARLNLGVVLAAHGKIDEAIVAYREALRLRQQSSTLHHALGVTLAAKGKMDEASGELAQALSLKPNDPSILSELAAVMKTQGKSDEAIAQYCQALRIAPGRRGRTQQPRPGAVGAGEASGDAGGVGARGEAGSGRSVDSNQPRHGARRSGAAGRRVDASPRGAAADAARRVRV